MALNLSAPAHSFVQFTVSDAIQSCEFADIQLCLPVYEDNDVAFQFIVTTDSEEEADDLCDFGNNLIQVGIVTDCGDDFLLEFTEKAERYRIGTTQILYNWAHGLTDFATVISRGECFQIKIIVDGTYSFCSNCFQRIATACHTSVIEYSNEDNFAGFNYCNSVSEEIDGGGGQGTCEKTIISFTNVPALTIPYTASLLAKHGNAPSVKVWIYDEQSQLVDMGIRITFDFYPPTELHADFGGNASGIFVIQ